MKKLIFLLLLISLLNSCANKGESVEINYYKENKIRRVEQYMYTYKFGKVDTTSKELNRVAEYDSLGNEIRYMYFQKGNSYFEVDTSDGRSIDSIIVIQNFDNNGNIISSIHYDKDGEIEYKSTNTYNNSNKLIDFIRYDKYGSMELKSHNEYDNKGKLLISTSIDLNNKSTEITTIKYDGDISNEIIVSDNNKKIISKNVLVTENDSLTIYDDYDSTNNAINRSEYKFKNKQLIGHKNIDLKTKFTTYESINRYNELNLKIESVSYSNGEPSILYKYFYYKY
jgi:hypothetical protein